MRSVFITVLSVVFLVACAPSTEIVKSWKDPAASFTQGPQNKTLVIAMVKDESSRRIVEDQIIKRMAGQAVASYSLLTPELMKGAEEATLHDILTQGQFTHILMTRLVDVDEETHYVPGTTTGYYGGWGRYYGYGAGFYTSPGYYETDKNYMVETTVYTVNPDKLVWAGTTKTVNPTKLEDAINDIADAVTTKMKEDGFITGTAQQ